MKKEGLTLGLLMNHKHSSTSSLLFTCVQKHERYTGFNTICMLLFVRFKILNNVLPKMYFLYFILQIGLGCLHVFSNR